MSGGGGLDVFIGTSAELNGDVILDLEPGESIVITDVTLAKADITFTAGSLDLNYLNTEGVAEQIIIDNGVIGDLGNYTVTTPPSGIGTIITNNPGGTNSAPIGVTYAIELDEDSPLTGILLATDPDGDPVQFANAGDPEHGTVVIDTAGGFTYTPDLNFNGTDYFAYAVGDGTNATVRVVTVTVNPVNDPPVAVDDSATTNEDTPVSIDVLANDTDDESSVLLVTAATADHGAVAFAGNGTITYTPDPDFNGTDTINYTVSDDIVGVGLTATGTVTVTVNPVNDDPVAVDDAAATHESTSVNIDVLGNDTDVDGDTLSTLSASIGANGATGVNPDGTVTYTPNAGFTGTDSFTYTAGDGHGGTDTATVTVTVNPNNPPIAVDDSATIAEDGGIIHINVRANDSDPDGDTILVTDASTPAHGVTTAQPGDVVYQPDPDFNGTDSFTYTITDQIGATATATVTVTVTPVNDAPVAVDDAVTTNEDQIVSIDVLANDTDVDGDTLSLVSAHPGTKGAIFNPGDGTLTYLPNANANGTDTFTYTITDNNGGTDTGTVTVTINPVNDAPVAHDDTALTSEGTPVNIDVLANDVDVDGDVLSIAAGGAATGGTINIQPDNTITFTPDTGFNGIATFGYTVFDTSSAPDSGAVTVYVAAEHAGTTGNDTFTFNKGDGLLRVIGFNASGSDQIKVSGFPGLAFAYLDTNGDAVLDANDTDVSGGSGGAPIKVDFGGGDILFVEGVASLSQDDLMFA